MAFALEGIKDIKEHEMKKEEMVKLFEERYLRGTCFETLEGLTSYKTNILVNSPRALIAVNLLGIWQGFFDCGGRLTDKGA